MLSLLRKLTTWTLSSIRWHSRMPQEALDQISDVTRVIMEWPDGEAFSAHQALQKFPHLQDSRESLINLVVHEFAELRGNGDIINVDEFVLEFPEDIRSELKDAIVVDCGMTVLSGLMTGLNTGSQGSQSRLTRNLDWPETGEIFAGFQLEEALGRGGFSRVFVAREISFENRLVALKICRLDTHEPSVLASLHHSGIGTVHSVTEVPERGLIAICMPLLSRTTLLDVRSHVWSRMRCPSTAARVWECVQRTNHLNRTPPFWSETSYCDWVLDVAISLSRALSVSHEKGIVHCDIKPSNVLVGEDGQPILFDFNIAFRELASNSPANVGGTIPYMAPEQIEAFSGRGAKNVGPRSDLFSLGATIYEMLTGTTPFGVSRPQEAGIDRLLELRETPPTRIQRLNPGVPGEFADLVHSCLACNIDERPNSASDLASQLEQLKKQNLRRTRSYRRVAAGIAGSITTAAVSAGLFISQTTDNDVIRTTAPNLSGAITHPYNVEPTRPVLTAGQVEKLMNEGYSLLENNAPDEAMDRFRDVLKFDEHHFGAAIGALRSSLSVMEPPVDADIRSIPSVFDSHSIPELEALCGTALSGCLSRNYIQGAFHLRNAIDAGINDVATLNNLAFCLYSQGKYEPATLILDGILENDHSSDASRLLRARLRIDAFLGETTRMTAPASLESCITELYSDDILNTCRPSALRSLMQARIEHACCVGYGHQADRQSEQLSDDESRSWLQHTHEAISFYEDAVKQGSHPRNWKLISWHLHPEVAGTDLCRERYRKYVKGGLTYSLANYRRGFLIDPLIGTRYERWKKAYPPPRQELLQASESKPAALLPAEAVALTD
jgi:serine/threonine protein kinase